MPGNYKCSWQGRGHVTTSESDMKMSRNTEILSWHEKKSQCYPWPWHIYCSVLRRSICRNLLLDAYSTSTCQTRSLMNKFNHLYFRCDLRDWLQILVRFSCLVTGTPFLITYTSYRRGLQHWNLKLHESLHLMRRGCCQILMLNNSVQSDHFTNAPFSIDTQWRMMPS